MTVFLHLWIAALGAALLAFPMVHAWQLEAYKPPQYLRWLRADRKRMTRTLALGWARTVGMMIPVTVILAFIGHRPQGEWLIWAGMIQAVFFMAAGSVWSAGLFFRAPHKKPLNITARIRRLLAAMAVLSAALAAVLRIPALRLIWVFHEAGLQPMLSFVLSILLFYTLSVAVQPLMVVLAGMLMRPVENRIKRWYFDDARRKLKSWDDMIKVGITGSYGKTSTKVILGTLLRQRYETMVTPHSYNTPMGVTRTIREQMTGREQVFVAEMGARQKGDITEMCELVAPRYGLLTSVGPQHLETFGTMETVARTKYELIESLPPDGWAFFPSDNDTCLELYRKTNANKALFGFNGHGERLFMTARDVETTYEGSVFTLVDDQGNTVRCMTRLLGRHNIINILGCAAVARKLDLTLDEIAAGIGQAEPVEHRLQLIPTDTGVTVIDDAFNASPDGARAALDVLASFPGRKIIVTPGLVELGETEERENEIFGHHMAGVIDIAILVAGNGAAMDRGLGQRGFPGRSIRVGNLNEASQVLAGLTQAGDVVLFENDLPDHYEQ